MAIDLTNINAALTRTGSEPITSLDEGGSGARIAKENYELIVGSALAHPFNFAKTFKPLNLLDAAVHGTPLPPWLFSYQLPTGMIELRALQVEGEPIEYATMDDKAFCDVGSESVVIAIYTWRPPESRWPPLFAEAITQRMEALFLAGIGERHGEAEGRERAARATMAMARLRDAQSRRSASDPRESPLLRARRG